MIDKSPEEAFKLLTPHHIHLSTPNLEQVPGNFNFSPLIKLVQNTNFAGWMVIEMLSLGRNNLERVFSSIKWLTEENEKHTND